MMLKQIVLWETRSQNRVKPFTEGEFLKSYMKKMCDVLCPDQKQLSVNVTIRRNTDADQVCEMVTNLKTQLKKDFVA